MKSLGVFVLLIMDETTLRLRKSFTDTIIPLLLCAYIKMWPFLILSEIFIIFWFIRNLLKRLVLVASYSRSNLGVTKRIGMKKRWIIFQISASSISNDVPSLQFLLLILIFLRWINLLKYIYYHQLSSFYWIYFLRINTIELDLSVIWTTINLSICFRIYAKFINPRKVTNTYETWYEEIG